MIYIIILLFIIVSSIYNIYNIVFLTFCTHFYVYFFLNIFFVNIRGLSRCELFEVSRRADSDILANIV